MNISRQLLAIIGKRLPAIYDVIPHGPQGRFSEVALNPQPLPPLQLGAAVAAEFVHTAWFAERFGLDMGVAFQDLDDWCPTVPKKLKLPPWWPPIPEPDPPPEWFIDFHLGFAARLAVLWVEFEGTRLGESFDKAIERSLASIEPVNTCANNRSSRRILMDAGDERCPAKAPRFASRGRSVLKGITQCQFVTSGLTMRYSRRR